MVKKSKQARRQRMNDLLASSRINNEDLKGLNWSELSVLKDRGKLSQAQERAAGFRPRRNLGGSFPPGEDPEYPQSQEFGEYNALRAQEEEEEEDEAEAETEGFGFGEDSDEDAAEDYSEWTSRELKDEIEERNTNRDMDSQLSSGGKVQELRERLMADDEDLRATAGSSEDEDG